MKKGFTLAEVLITLTIIGVIAALTIPNLMRKWGDHADIAKVKETISILSNAMKMAVAENGPIDSWSWENGSKHVQVSKMFAKYLKVTCNNGNCMNYGWTQQGEYQYPKKTSCYFKALKGILRTSNGPDNDIYRNTAIQLNNGAVIAFEFYTNNNSIKVDFDINGVKKPAQFGYDMFRMYFNNYGVSSFSTAKNNCNGHGGATFNLDDGTSCAYWIVKHGNMDYKYRDISTEW